MSSTILYDGYHLTAAAGTGIATYTRQLALTARLAGYQTQALFGVQNAVNPSVPLLAEVSLFDAEPETPPRRLTRMLRFARTWPGAPFGIKTLRVPFRGDVVGSGVLKGFNDVLVARRTHERAKAHFLRTGRFARLKLAGDVAAFHATYPVPLYAPGRANLVTIHDLIPLRLPYASLDDKNYYYGMVKRAADEADHIVTVSEHSRRDIVKLLGVSENKVTNTYQAIALQNWMADVPDGEVARDLRNGFGLEPGGYFLFYGALEPKKNVGRLVEAYALSGSKRPLVIAGGLGWQYKDDLKRIDDERFLALRHTADETFGLERRVRRLPYVPGDLLVSLIKGARAVLFPSLYEGFGLPVVESMSLGTPVLTSTAGSLPEIAGDAALLVDPHDIRAMSYGIERLDGDDALRAELSAKGVARAATFGRAAYVERIQALYGRVLAGR